VPPVEDQAVSVDPVAVERLEVVDQLVFADWAVVEEPQVAEDLQVSADQPEDLEAWLGRAVLVAAGHQALVVLAVVDRQASVDQSVEDLAALVDSAVVAEQVLLLLLLLLGSALELAQAVLE